MEEIDSKLLIKLIRDIMFGVLDLRNNLQKIEKKSVLNSEEKEDHFIMFRSLEIGLKQSLYNEEQLKFYNNILKKRNEDLLIEHKNLIDKTKKLLNDSKEDYVRLLDVVDFKDFDIQNMKIEQEKQKDIIQSLEERILSIFVLEYKMKSLDFQHKKEIEKLQYKLNSANSNKNSSEKSNFTQNLNNQEIENKFITFQNIIKEQKKQNYILNENANKKQQLLEIALKNKEKLLIEKNEETEKLKEELIEKRKKCYMLKSNFNNTSKKNIKITNISTKETERNISHNNFFVTNSNLS